VPSQSLLAAARTLLDEDSAVAWKLDEHDNLLVTLRSDPSRWFSLDVGSDAFLSAWAIGTPSRSTNTTWKISPTP
jgi:hypothetical protein